MLNPIPILTSRHCFYSTVPNLCFVPFKSPLSYNLFIYLFLFLLLLLKLLESIHFNLFHSLLFLLFDSEPGSSSWLVFIISILPPIISVVFFVPQVFPVSTLFLIVFLLCHSLMLSDISFLFPFLFYWYYLSLFINYFLAIQ